MSFKTQPPSRGSLKQRFFAWQVSQNRTYTDPVIAERKRRLFGNLHGEVLEIGPGAGSNLRYFSQDVRWVGVEPNPSMHPYLLQTIRKLGWSSQRYRIDPGDPAGMRLPAADASLDAVVCTQVLCSVPYPEDSLQEVLRVLKPGGRFAFIEHVAAPHGSGLRTLQNFIQPAWTFFAEGCHPNRETGKAIAQAGFACLEIEQYRYPEWGPVAPHIAGCATK
jgi:SAM-dependent methyltransferase